MIITERIGNLYHTYSNRGVYIHGGYPEADYAEALDPVERVYEETELPIDEELSPEQVLDILFGGDGNEQSESN